MQKYAAYMLKDTPDILCKRMGVNIENIQNCIERNNKLYSTFSQQLVTNGSIIWHQYDEIHDTVIMSDYNSSTGTLSPLSYAHVTCITSVHGSSNYLLKFMSNI